MHPCPVCGYPKLQEAPRSKSGGGSYEICPSCGFQFGVDDDDKGITFDQARERWIEGGMRWHSKGMPAPKDWKPQQKGKAVARKKSPGTKKPAPAKKIKKVAKATAKSVKKL